MCGIAGLIYRQQSGTLPQTLLKMSQALAHRGPDGEGFLLANPEHCLPFNGTVNNTYDHNDLNYIPKQHISTATGPYSVGLAHRRLSIIDLSSAGHQPMSNSSGDLWITYNGEIYNYPELQKELKALGHKFRTHCDTEVVLAAYMAWGPDCVKKFNGMWSFCIYDHNKRSCFASRDRLGVKPFYYQYNHHGFAFASEQKAFVKAGLITASASEANLAGYLLNVQLETSEKNFFEGILELMPGHNLHYDLREHSLQTSRYYSIHPNLENQHLDDKQLVEKIRKQLQETIKFRLRSDVEVGTCLSGGLDSSVLAVIMNSLAEKSVHCFTSIFPKHSSNEEEYADVVAAHINCEHHKIHPKPEDFLNDIDQLIYALDAPIWDTSTYAQFSVMKLASVNKIKVVLDGQGADELFAGYHHHYVALWNDLLGHGNLAGFGRSLMGARRGLNNPLFFYTKEVLKGYHNPREKKLRQVISRDFIDAHGVQKTMYAHELNQQLTEDIYSNRLKSFLRCEDRCGMWHSVESRTPFSDDPDLINLMFSFRSERKIKNGILKYLLREALRPQLPSKIYERYDKKGFETPMAEWMQQLRKRIVTEVSDAGFPFVRKDAFTRLDFSKPENYKLAFRLFVFAKWRKVFA